jgi:hypothetical protein
MCILTLDALQHIIEEQATQNITFPNMDIPINTQPNPFI